MTRYVLLLRAVNLGPRNKLAMADLRRVLEGLGYDDVKTYLNSGNATFEATGTARRHAEAVETALEHELGLSVRAAVRRTAEVRKMVEAIPDDLEGYVTVAVLVDSPSADALKALADWGPETVVPGPGCVYVGYPQMAGTRLDLDKQLGSATTARTPATLRKLL